MFLFIGLCSHFEAKGSLFKYILCSYLSVPGGGDNPDIFQFKYILCSYLSESWIVILPQFLNLNTSYVLIYHTGNVYFAAFKVNLNTSYVLIYLVIRDKETGRKYNLNTSYVLIYPLPIAPFSIINLYLNTSYVLIYLVKSSS